MVTRICQARSVKKDCIAAREISCFLKISVFLCRLRRDRHPLSGKNGSEARESHGISQRFQSAPSEVSDQGRGSMTIAR